MKSIEILPSDYVRLQNLAEPFIDTPSTVLTRILDFYEATGRRERSKIGTPPRVDVLEFAAESPPDFTHTKLMMARFGAENIENVKWDAALRFALLQVYRKYGNTADVRRVSGANIFDGEKTTEGYKPLPSTPFSYQGQSAVDIAKCVIRSAVDLGVPLQLEFEWRSKPEAQFPGKRGRLLTH